MGLAKPDIKTSKPFADAIGPDQPFILDGIRTVRAHSAEFGDGEMVVITARGHADELTIWGAYLLAQAKGVEASDLGKHYVLRANRMVPEFSKRPVKALVPYDPETDQEIPF